MRVSSSVFGLWVALTPDGASAADDAAGRAAALHAQAGEAFVGGRYAEGIAMEEAAFALEPDPQYLLNIALARQRLAGACVATLADLDRYLAACAGRTCSEVTFAAQRRAKVLAGCELEVTFTVQPADAVLTIDEVAVAHGTTRHRLLPGDHRMAAEARGHHPIARMVHVAADATQFAVVLDPLPVPPPAPSTHAPEPAPAGEAAAVQAQARTEPTPATSARPAWVYATLGAGAAGLIVSGVAGYLTLSAMGTESDERHRETPRVSSVRAANEDARTRASVAWIALGCAVPLSAVGLWGFFDAEPVGSSPSAAFRVGPGGLVLEGAF